MLNIKAEEENFQKTYYRLMSRHLIEMKSLQVISCLTLGGTLL